MTDFTNEVRPTPAEMVADELAYLLTSEPALPERIFAALADAGYMVVPKGPVRLLDGNVLEQRNRAVRALHAIEMTTTGPSTQLARDLLDEPWVEAVLDDD